MIRPSEGPTAAERAFAVVRARGCEHQPVVRGSAGWLAWLADWCLRIGAFVHVITQVRFRLSLPFLEFKLHPMTWRLCFPRHRVRFRPVVS